MLLPDVNILIFAKHAAIAFEHGCTMVSTDSDFGRFPGVRWQHPLRPGGLQRRSIAALC